MGSFFRHFHLLFKWLSEGPLLAILVEFRRVFNLIFVPWVSAFIICLMASWYCIYVVGLDALLAPVLKTWFFLKPFLMHALKFVVAFLIWIWVNSFAKLGSWLGEILLVIWGYLGGWKAWSLKKFVRQGARFLVSFTTRFVLISVLLNLLFGRERKGMKGVPALVTNRLKRSPLGKIIHWWGDSSERQKRLLIGIVLCIVLVIAGHTLLGFSILLFDLMWELVLVIGRWLLRLWRLLLPIIMRFVPNVLLNFITRKLLPLFAEVIPIVRDDHRVMYLRLNLKRHYRNSKATLYRKSRSKRSKVRVKIRPFIGGRIRSKKIDLIDAAASNHQVNGLEKKQLDD